MNPEINITPPRKVPDLMAVRGNPRYYTLCCVSELTLKELTRKIPTPPTRIAWTGEVAQPGERYAQFCNISDAIYFAGLHGYRVLGSRGEV